MDSDFVVFDAADINYIELARPTKNADKQPLYYTKHGAYFSIGSLEGLAIVLRDYGITNLDSVNLVNISNIEYVEETRFYVRAHFPDGSYATVSKANMHKIQGIPRK